MGRPERCCEVDLEAISYDGHHAAEDLEEWRRRGVRPTTRELIDALLAQDIAGARLVDIGAGVGMVHLTLLEAGAASAVDVDASQEYLDAARSEATRRGLVERVEYLHGDVVALTEQLTPADVVTLDTVICCYPFLAPLLDAATRPGPRLVGLTYPRDVWWMRIVMNLWNIRRRLQGLRDFYWIHTRREVEEWMRGAGYALIHDGGIRSWSVLVYRR